MARARIWNPLDLDLLPEQALHKMFDHLEPQTLLNLRLTSKSINTKVSKYAANHFRTKNTIFYGNTLRFNYDYYLGNTLPVILDMNHFERMQNIMRNWQETEISQRDLILPGRHIKILNLSSLKPPDFNGVVKHPIYKLLENMGPGLWHLSVLSRDTKFHNIREMNTWYKAIRKLLDLVSGLKSLVVQAPEVQFDLTNENMALMNRLNFTICKMPELTLIQLDSVMFHFAKVNLQANKTIEKMTLNLCHDLIENSKRSGKHFTDQLMEVSLGYFPNLWADLVVLRLLQWPVTKLSINCEEVIEHFIPDSVLRMFKKTLRKFYISNVRRPSSGTFPIEFPVPHLQVMEIELHKKRRRGETVVYFTEPPPKLVRCEIIK